MVNHFRLFTISLVMLVCAAVVAPIYSFALFSVLIIVLYIALGVKDFRYPYIATIVIFIVAYTRLAIPVFDAEGVGNRGALALGDVIWLLTIICLVLRDGGRLLNAPVRLVFPAWVWGLLPFVVLAVVLPFFGLAFEQWPLSYAVPGIRQLQWTSFFFLGSYVSWQYGDRFTVHALMWVCIIASVLNAGYGSLQLGYYAGLLPGFWVLPDRIFELTHPNSWFYYPRLTGLLANPNSLGVFSAFVVAMTGGALLTRYPFPKWALSLALLSGLYCLLFSASRSALVGLFIAAAFLVCWLLWKKKHVLRIYRSGLFLLLIGITLLPIIFSLMPEHLTARFASFLDIFSVGISADETADARTVIWAELLRVFWQDYPLGTGVPPGYAFSAAVDNHYMYVFLQGGFPNLVSFLLLIFSALVAAVTMLKIDDPSGRMGGIILLSIVGVVIGASVSLSPLHQPEIVVPFWVALAIAFAHGRRLSEAGPGPFAAQSVSNVSSS